MTVAKNPSIDLLKGVLILLVMAGHAMEVADAHGLALWIGAGFRMPLMIGISGYLLNLTRTREAPGNVLAARYFHRMLLPWLVATAVYMSISRHVWDTPLDLLLRPAFHLWYVPVLFFLIMMTRLFPLSPLLLLVAGTPISLSIMYAFGLNHGPVADGLFAPDSRFLRYPVYFFFGMLLAERQRKGLQFGRALIVPALILAGAGCAWWAALYPVASNLAYVPARLLMSLGLIALLPGISAIRMDFGPVTAIGRDSLFHYLWHPLLMGLMAAVGAKPLTMLALSILLLAVSARLGASKPLVATLLGIGAKRARTAAAPAMSPA